MAVALLSWRKASNCALVMCATALTAKLVQGITNGRCIKQAWYTAAKKNLNCIDFHVVMDFAVSLLLQQQNVWVIIQDFVTECSDVTTLVWGRVHHVTTHSFFTWLWPGLDSVSYSGCCYCKCYGLANNRVTKVSVTLWFYCNAVIKLCVSVFINLRCADSVCLYSMEFVYVSKQWNN